MSDIDIISVDPKDSWPVEKKQYWEHLEILTVRIVAKGEDITSNLGEDYFYVRMVYAIFGDVARQAFHTVVNLAKDYEFDRCDDDFNKAVEKTKFKSIQKLVKICRFYKIDTSFEDESIDDVDSLYFLPDSVNRSETLQNGFYPLIDGAKTGYYFRTGEKSYASVCNFVMEPLIHVYNKVDNKRILAINNGKKKSVIDMPSRMMISLDQFAGRVMEEGNYIFYGSKVQLMRIISTINEHFPVCYELKTLGWQPEGFFSWSNAVFDINSVDEEVIPYSDLGIVEIGDTHFFSPSASDIHKNVRADDDEYESDRSLTWIAPAIDFESWMELMMKVYYEDAMIGISFIFISLFKDIIFKVDNNCPLLSCYGEKGSGKNKFAESLTALFLHDLGPFNLNHGTDFAFFNRLSRFRNCLTWFDEFDDGALKEDRFQSIKGAYDGSGRERGKGTNKNKTEIAKINSALILTGQYISTRDDNAALTRCIILPFQPNDNRADEQIKNFDKLKRLEKKGLTGLISEILVYRKEFQKSYSKIFPEIFRELKSTVTDQGAAYKERVVRNYCAALSCVKFFSEKFKFPFTYKTFFDRCVKDVIRLSTMISESDSLADFWNTIVYLLETGDIQDGFHFMIKEEKSVKVKTDSKASKEVKFPGQTKLLYLRLTTIHKLYLEAFRRQNGKNGINMQSLQLYISSAKSFIGVVNSVRFTDRNGQSAVTSAYVFDYVNLAVPLERLRPDEAQDTPLQEVSGTLAGGHKIQEIAGKPTLRYTIRSISTYKIDGFPVEKTTITYIYDQNLQNSDRLRDGLDVVVTGRLKEVPYTDQWGNPAVRRSLEADSLRFKSSELPFEGSEEDTPF